ncbi:MAG TPA: TIR domain-containing protein [Methylomirabilota bacterium]|nr:TIR domain-containing protein [Methylomirabilota bacterium]
MARRVFFSFHYERDIWRASQVRNSWVAKPDRETAGFWDSASWEEVKRQGETRVKQWIDRQLSGTTVTAVLIGAQTSQRPYVGYEIVESCKMGNGLLGIYIHNIRDQSSSRDLKGENPLHNWWIVENGRKTYLDSMYPTYDWVSDRGYENFGTWVEEAAQRAGL